MPKKAAKAAAKAAKAHPVPTPTNPAAAAALAAAGEELKDLEGKRQGLVEELRVVEKQIFDLETRYLASANPQGNALKGYESLLSAAQSAGAPKRGAPKAEERIFSLSSTTGR